MMPPLTTTGSPPETGYLIEKKQAWFAFAMTFALMLFDYMDRQVIVSLFPHIKAAWNLSDKQLGGLVSIISIVVAMGGIPVALLADRLSRVKSIVVMATTWSLATIYCMFAGNYAQLFGARAVVGLGETGYGSVGSALLSNVFPKRMRGALMGALFAAASLGSVFGVVLGGVIAAKWGWKAAFGVVGVPGLVLALLYLLVRDYKTVALTPKLNQVTQSIGGTLKHIFNTLARTPTLRWICIGQAMQVLVVSAIWSWLPSYLNRFHGMAPDQAGKQAALVILAGAFGGFLWGVVIDRLSIRRPHSKLPMLSLLCLVSLVILTYAFNAPLAGPAQLKLIIAGGFFMTCSVGVVVGVLMDVVHPGLRSTGAAVLSLFQNLLGLAVGPFLVGVLSDMWGLQHAMAVIPAFSILAAAFFMAAARSYEADAAPVSGIALDVTQCATAHAAG
ncbi:MAG: MFS transporter [Collimonas sp.]|uniref:MFS transporter n=1 Tax=Collimonas sp. TaxID=1963772 RepID=UPI003266D6E2